MTFEELVAQLERSATEAKSALIVFPNEAAAQYWDGAKHMFYKVYLFMFGDVDRVDRAVWAVHEIQTKFGFYETFPNLRKDWRVVAAEAQQAGKESPHG